MKERASAAHAALVFGSLWGLAEATAGHALHALRVPGLAGFLMFPLGFFLMSRAAARAGRPSAAMLTSAVAASVKLVDLLLPGVDVMAVLNPAQAILLQGLAAAVLLSVFGAETTRRLGRLFSGKTEAVSLSGTPGDDFRNAMAKRSGGNAFPAEEIGSAPNGAGPTMRGRPPVLIAVAAGATSLAWRAAHLALGLFWAALFQAPNILQAGSALFLRFLVLDGLVNGALIFVLMKASSSLKKDLAHPGVFRLLFRPAASLICLVFAVLAEAAL
ncbi:MAG: hypothetical protein FJY83_01990 [Candidatus Aminicenantes bacterium]|nr:hypothetical protein [Candidatus Aminicenantes bacterium]